METYSDEEKENKLLEIFGFCGCGQPDKVLKWVLERMEWMDTRVKMLDDDFRKNFDMVEKMEVDLFGSHEAADFFYYWLDERKLSEHGGAIPGWLTAYGKMTITLLKEYLGEK